MTYKVELGEITHIELDVGHDMIINVHLAQGYEKDGNYVYESFMNTDMNEEQCEDVINALTYALHDLKVKREKAK